MSAEVVRFCAAVPDSKRCPVFQAAIAYLSAPIEPDPGPELPEIRFDAALNGNAPLDATQVFTAVLDLDPADFYRPDESERELAEAAR